MIRLKKNQLAMFHVHELSVDVIDYIVRHCNAVKIVNELDSIVSHYSNEEIEKYSFIRKRMKILDELKEKIDIFECKEV